MNSLYVNPFQKCLDQFIVERANINQSKDVPSRGVWLLTLSPGKQSLLLFSNQPIQLITGQYSGKWLTKTIFEFRGEGFRVDNIEY